MSAKIKTDIIYKPSGRAEEYSLLAANLYAGCGHGCTYCYAPAAMRTKRAEFVKPRVRKNVIARFRRDAEKLAGTDKRVLLSFATDPYQQLESSQGLTREAIRILTVNDVPFQVLTKGGMRAAKDFSMYGPDDMFGTTMTFWHDVKASKKWEPKAALPEDRADALSLAHALKIKTWVSLEPVIDPLETYAIIGNTHKFVDHYKVGKLNYVENDIDWELFARGVLAIFSNYGVKSYYIKKDLQGYLKPGEYENTDIRKVVT